MTETAIDPAQVLSAAQEIYHAEGLDVPPIPPSLDMQLRSISETAFASRDVDWTLYDLQMFVDELVSGQAPAPYVAFGLAGHGIASQGVHYYNVTEHAAVFLQVRWGTIFDDPEAAGRYAALVRISRRLLDGVDASVAAGKFPAGNRLVVVHSDFQGSRWTWLPTASTSAPKWKRSEVALYEAQLGFAPGQPYSANG